MQLMKSIFVLTGRLENIGIIEWRIMMNKLQSDSLSQYLDLLASDISDAARYLGCDKYEYKFTDKYYHIEINIKQNNSQETKEKIVASFKSGKSRHDISNELGTDYQYVCNVIRHDKYIKSKHYPDWYMTLSDALFAAGASGRLQTTISDAFYNYGFKSLEEIKQYCEMFDYGNRPFRCYNNHKFPVSGIGKKSYYYLRKVFMEKDK